MMKLLPTACLALMIVAAFGCGSSGSGKAVVAPDTPGDAASLEGTVWADPETQLAYAFHPGGRVERQSPALGQAVPGQYAVENGIITVDVGLQSIDGTWTGEELVLDGTKLTRQ